ncbi:MAG: transglycosylase SLT domain-containing protein [Polyangiaceae bacterium]
MRSLLDDPRLGSVKTALRQRDDRGAFAAFLVARGQVALLAGEACPWDYLEGRLANAAGDVVRAAQAFDRAGGAVVGGPTCAIAPFANLRAAESYAKQGLPDAAMDRARRVPTSSSASNDAILVVAQAAAETGHDLEAIAIYRTWLEKGAKLPRWPEVATRLAKALDARAQDDATVLREAYELATRVTLDAPRSAEIGGVPALRAVLGAKLRKVDPKVSSELDASERARLAQGWLDAQEPKKALTEANAVLATKGPKPTEAACKAAIVRAEALAKTKAPTAADAWGDAIGLCATYDGMAKALFAGAKASLHAKRTDEARDRFAKVEELLPKHRFADDARLHGALLALDAGNEERFTSMLMTLPDSYPEGDMRMEGLFRVALLRFARGDFAAAKVPLDRILELDPDDRHWATAGRAAYFRAKVSERLGDRADADVRYARIVETYPLTYYMTQAYTALAASDPARAKDTLAKAIERDAATPAPTVAPVPEGGVEVVVGLLEVGEPESARREVAATGVLDEGRDPATAWEVGRMFDEANAPEIGFAIARSQQRAYLPHYPVGGWRAGWEAAFPRAFGELVVAESAAKGLSPALTWAIMREESSFVADVRSHANAFGLMQLIVPTAALTARGTGLPSDEAALKRPEVNVALGTRLLASLRATYAHNPSLAIAAYNGGAGAVNRWVTARPNAEFDVWVEQIPYEETRGYLKRVLATEATYAFLHAPATLDEVLAIPRRVAR